MKRAIPVLLFVALLAGTTWAQTSRPVGEAEPGTVVKDSAQQLLKEVSVTRFEDGAFYFATISMDQGFATLRRFEGSPMEKESIEDEEEIGITAHDDYVLGAKVEFLRRGPHQLMVGPVKPIQIEGIVKTLSLWVVGRNYNHVLKLVIRDYFGELKELTVGRLNFMGWKKMTVAVPTSIVQDEYHYSNRAGLQFEGIKIEFDMMETYGQYYVYFDDLRAWTDLFREISRDEDDMSDDW